MAAAILLFCFQGAGRKLSTECRPVAEKVRRLGAKGTKEQGLAGVCAPSPCRPSAEKVRRLGAKGTKEQGFAGICAPSPRRPSAEKVRRLGAKGTKEQGFAGICAPSPRRPSAEKARRFGAKGTKEQGFAGICAPSPRRPSAEKVRRLGAKGTKEQGAAGICAPSRHRPSVNPGPKNRKAQPDTGKVGARLPAKPYASVARRQHFALERGRTPAELAPHCRQSLVPPLRGANILPWSAAGHRPSWRPITGKALCLRYEAPTFCPGALPGTAHVGARLPAKPYASVTRRQHLALRHRPCWRPSSRPPKNNKKTSNLSCSSMVRDQGFEPWTP